MLRRFGVDLLPVSIRFRTDRFAVFCAFRAISSLNRKSLVFIAQAAFVTKWSFPVDRLKAACQDFETRWLQIWHPG
jgi:hypothetical protein